jgi:plasmid stabilization system protein ParE
VKLRFTTPALADLASIFRLHRHPFPGERGSRRAENKDYYRSFTTPSEYDPAIRRLPVTAYPYLIFYEIADDEIIIHAVRHTARDPSSMPGA